jgi:hypothetical protein
MNFAEKHSMSQQQRDIRIELLDGMSTVGASTGNNAAWICQCSRTKPLLGFSSSAQQVSKAVIVVCPDCGRRYHVVAPTNRGVPSHVKEI